MIVLQEKGIVVGRFTGERFAGKENVTICPSHPKEKISLPYKSNVTYARRTVIVVSPHPHH